MKKWMTMILALLMMNTLAACGSKDKPSTPETEQTEQNEQVNPSIDLSAFYQELAEAYGWDDDYMVEIEGEILGQYYPGLADIPTKQFIAKTPMMGAAALEIVLMECENEEDAAAAAEILEERIRYQVGDENNPGGAWYPETIEGWSKGQVITQGNYVFLAVDASEQDDLVERINTLLA